MGVVGLFVRYATAREAKDTAFENKMDNIRKYIKPVIDPPPKVKNAIGIIIAILFMIGWIFFGSSPDD